MELMNSTQRVIAVLWESFKSTLFAVLVQVLLGRSDCDGGVRLGFKLKSLKRSCREIGFQSFLEHEGSGAIQDAALTLPRRVSSKGFIHITYAVLSSTALSEVASAGFLQPGLLVSVSSFPLRLFWSLNASPVALIGVCETMTEIKSAYNFWSLQLFPCFGGHITSPKAFLAAPWVFWQKRSL